MYSIQHGQPSEVHLMIPTNISKNMNHCQAQGANAVLRNDTMLLK